MVALNKNATATTLPLARFSEMLTGVRQGRDVTTGTVYRLDGTVTLPARGALVLELQ
jgi:hypothetical protein